MSAARRTIAVLFAVALMCPAASADDRGVTNTSASPHVRLRSVDLDDVRWTEGFWAEKFALCRTAIVPAVERGLLDPRNSEQLRDLRVAAGLEPGSHRGTNWGDGDCYKWLEAVALVYAVTKDPKLDRQMDEWIEVIAKAQAPDGYISTNITTRASGDPRARLDMPYFHEMYNMGHLLTAACIHHRATGKDNFLRLAVKTGDFLDKQFGPRPPRLVHFPWNPSAHMGLVELYRTTGDRRYLELAEILIGNRGSSPGDGDHRNGGTDQTQDRVPIREEREAVGHAVCATYLYCGAADLYAETGDAALLEGLRRVWRNVTTRRMYVTGAVGAGGGRSSRGDPVHEAFLAEYKLPNRTAYAETCANIGNAMWNYRMLTISGEAKYADVMERVLYNTLLSAVSVDGKGFFYCNPLRWTGEQGGPTRHHTATRWPIHGCYCCPPQVARTIAKLRGWAYSVSEDAIWVNLYGGSRLETELADGSPIALLQQTDYPWNGRVKITVERCPERRFALMLRIPGWAREASIRVNGQPWAGLVTTGTYAALRRDWAPGDVVELDLPMPVQLIEAHPEVRDIRNYVAVMRGPVVYCLELPVDRGGAATWQAGVFLPENVVLTARHDERLLGGVTVLEGTALTFEGRDRFIEEAEAAAKPFEDPRDWDGVLYRPLEPRKLKQPDSGTIPITLIPYFAWANRGVSYMEVWIPLARRVSARGPGFQDVRPEP